MADTFLLKLLALAATRRPSAGRDLAVGGVSSMGSVQYLGWSYRKLGSCFSVVERLRRGAYPAVAIAGLLAVMACMSPSLSREEQKLYRELGSGSPPQWTSDGETVVGQTGQHLYAVKADGSEFRRLTTRWAGRHYHPALRADGRLAYFTNSATDHWLDRLFVEYTEWSVRIGTFDGGALRTEQTTHLELGGGAYPRWSPDGSLLLYRAADLTVILDETGTELHSYFVPMIEGWGDKIGARRAASWSNDGQRIALSARPYQHPWRDQIAIVTLRPDGSDPRVVFKSTGIVDEISNPVWSADDTRIYFATRRREDKDAVLYSIGHDGSDLRKLAQLRLGSYFDIELSPTGDELLMVSRWTRFPGVVRARPPYDRQPEGTGLYTIKVDGTDWRHIRSGYLHASWSPNGDRIAVIDMDPTGERGTVFYTIHPDGAPDKILMGRTERGRLVAGKGAQP